MGNENSNNNAVTMPSPSADQQQQQIQQPSSNVTGSGNSIEGRMSLFRRNSRLRQSMTSEGGFGRAMSGLSALSIDWENMEDFDVNIDHSSHINNTNLSEPITKKNYSPANENIKTEEDNTTSSNNAANGMQSGCAMVRGGICDCGPTCACVGCPVSFLFLTTLFFIHTIQTHTYKQTSLNLCFSCRFMINRLVQMIIFLEVFLN